jgi:CheY-like chemotaxis protein
MSDGFKFSVFGRWRGEKRSSATTSDTPQKKSSSDAPPAVERAPIAILSQSLAHASAPAAEALVAAMPQSSISACELRARLSNGTELGSGAKSPQSTERRRRRRALISAPVRLRSVDTTGAGPDEVTTTTDVSRAGILFTTTHPGYYRGMDLAVTFPYSKTVGDLQIEQSGRIVRLTELPDGRRSVGVALGEGIGEDLVDSNGQRLPQTTPPVSYTREAGSNKPLILALDGNEAVRRTLKTYLSNEGYEVIAVQTADEAREVLSLFTPSLLIAEIEGEGMPGYQLCSHVKTTPRLQTIPVMLVTSSAYPSDYASAHSRGAVVCMAKPYKLERLGHVVRLLAPPPNANNSLLRPHPVDPTRRVGRTRDKAPSAHSLRGLRLRNA